MSAYYNDIGKLILDVPINADNVEALKNGNILYDTSKKLAYIIKNVKTDTTQNRITANGFTTNQILNNRVTVDKVVTGTVEDAIYSSVENNLRGLQRVSVADPKGLTGETLVVLSAGNLLDKIIPILSNAALGHRMNWSHERKEHIFEIYKGTDLTTGIHAVVFSEEQGTARNLVINDDASEFKNYVYVRARFKEGESETEVLATVGTAAGDDRHELWLDASLPPKNGETEAAFRERLKEYGTTELGKRIRKLTFSVTVDPSEFGELYNIGDLVSCVSNRFGVRFNTRIAGVKYKKDSNTETTELILGEPVLI
jgi:hypothetical protein